MVRHTAHIAHDFQNFLRHRVHQRRVMSKAEDASLSGQWGKISARKLELAEHTTMTFERTSCDIQDRERKMVENSGPGDGKVTRGVLTGYRCYVNDV